MNKADAKARKSRALCLLAMLLFALSYKNVKKRIGKKLINFAFTHLKKQNEMRSRLGWTISYE